MSKRESVAADVPDWLSDAAPVEAEMSEFVSESAQSEFEPAVSEFASDSPHWLSEADTAVPDEVPTTGLIGRFKTGELSPMMPELEAEKQPDSGTVTPEWLKEMQPPDDDDEMVESPEWATEIPAEEQEAVAEPAFDWLTTAGTPDVAEAVVDETPEWLSISDADESLPVSDTIAEVETQAQDAGFDWLATSESAPVSDTLMSQDTETEAVGDGEFEWLAQNEPQSQPETPAVPDWLAQAQPFGEEESAEAETPVGELDIQAALERGDMIPPDQMEAWMSQQLEIGAQRSDDFPEFEEEPVAQAEVPDWLTDVAPAEPAETTPSTVDAGALAALFDSQPAESVGSDEPGWLTQMQPEDDLSPQAATTDEFSWSTEANAVEEELVDEPDWLSEMQAAPRAQAIPEMLEEIQTDEPEWLSEIQPNMETEPATESTGDGFDWNVDNDVAARVSSDLPDWVTGAQPEETTVSEIETTEDWEMADLETSLDQIPAEIVPDDYEMPVVAQPIDEYPHEWAGSDMPDEQPAAPAAARNAPDWLNAMVPGLDVDYVAPEDEPIETEFLPGSENRAVPIFQTAASASPQPSEFNWLMDIVEHETQQVGSVNEALRQPRFVFTREPAWLRKPTEQRDIPAGETDDIDLPPWLR